MNKKTSILLVLSNIIFYFALKLGYNSMAPIMFKGIDVNKCLMAISLVGIFLSTIMMLVLTLIELITKKNLNNRFYFILSLLTLNPLSCIFGFMLYKENGGEVKNTRLALIVMVYGLVLSVWTLNVSRIVLNFLLTADADTKSKVLNYLYLYKFILAFVALIYVCLPALVISKAKVGVKIISMLSIPVALFMVPVGLFAYGQIDLIDYEFKSKKENNELPDDVLVRMENVGIGFGKGLKVFQVVEGLNLDIYKGETLGLVGESGSGKTTIGRAIIGVNQTNSGKIIYHNKVINGHLPTPVRAEVKKGIQMIFQDPAASLNERTTVDYIISEGLRSFHLYENDKDRQRKVLEAIRSVGLLPEHLSRYPHEFSGGQRQRIGIARAIVMEPEFIIADEPISALDVSIRAQVLNLLKKFQHEKGLTYLFIAHDLSVVRHVADRIAVIYKGKIVELAESEELFLNPMHAYTKSLLSAIPVPDPDIERNKKIIKYVPTNDGKERSLKEVKPGHFVRASDEELEEMKKEVR